MNLSPAERMFVHARLCMWAAAVNASNMQWNQKIDSLGLHPYFKRRLQGDTSCVQYLKAELPETEDTFKTIREEIQFPTAC